MKKYLLLLLAMLAGNAQAFDIYNGTNAAGKPQWSSSSVRVDNSGNPLTEVPTYSYQASDVAPAATATDVVCLTGSASKVIRLERVQITAEATGAAMIDFYVYKRSAANTGGTVTQPAITKMDSINAAATGVINLYSANPSALGSGTILAGDHYELPAITGNTYSSPAWIEDFGIRNSQSVVLRGTSEQACFSLNGQILPAGLSVYVRMEWTETQQ